MKPQDCVRKQMRDILCVCVCVW